MVNKFDKLIDSNIIWLSNLEDISKLKQKIKNKKLIMFLPISINNAVKKIEIIQFEDRDILVMTEEILKLYLRELEKSGVNEVIFSIIPGSNLNFLDFKNVMTRKVKLSKYCYRTFQIKYISCRK